MNLKNTDRNGAIARGLRIRQARQAKGYNQENLAKLVDTTSTTISKIETGFVLECGSGMLGRIATVLGTSFEWLEYGKQNTSIVITRDKNQTIIEDLPEYRTISEYVPLFTWESIVSGRKTNKQLRDLNHPFVEQVGKASFDSFAIKLEGVSMKTRDLGSHCFNEGEILYFDPETKVSNKDFVCAHIKNEEKAIFRQYIIDCGKAFLFPLNTQFPVIEITKDVKILGVWYYKGYFFEKPDVALHKLRNNKKMIKEKV